MNLDLTEKDLAAIRAEFCKGFTQEQFDVAMTFCRVRNLLPGKHVLFQLRRSKEWDEIVGAKVEVTKIVFITTIDASRLIAQRTGFYGGPAPEQYIYLDDNGSPSIVSEIPLPKLPLVSGQTPLPREPWAVKTTVYRKDFDHPVSSVARFDAYASTYKTATGPQLTEMWSRRGPEQLSKCSEMLSLRRAFPEELGGLYISEEFKAENEDAPVTPASVTVAAPVAPVVPKVDQKPAEPTNAPRPGENKISVETAKLVAETISEVEKILETPEVQKRLAEEGKKVDHAKISRLKAEAAAVLASTPGLKPASELKEPKKTKAKKDSPNNGQTVRNDGITDADISNAGTPAPEITPANKQAGADFVESLDPTPTKDEMKTFTDRVRALAAAGALNADLKNYILNKGGKSDPKQLTVGNWNSALDELEVAQKEGKLKEVTKNAPLPDKF